MDRGPDPTGRRPSRRTFVATVTALLSGIAGCTDAGEEGDGAANDGGTEDEDDRDGDEGDDEQSTTAQTTDELDLREANVVEVAIDGEAGEYTFDVTLYHDDEGEGGYANWWQVESLDGERLGRRDLSHAHGTEPFTRSATVSVPSGVDCVVVRGHDQTHEYGGRAMLVAVGDGTMRTVRQGSEPSSFDESDCPA